MLSWFFVIHVNLHWSLSTEGTNISSSLTVYGRWRTLPICFPNWWLPEEQSSSEEGVSNSCCRVTDGVYSRMAITQGRRWFRVFSSPSVNQVVSRTLISRASPDRSICFSVQIWVKDGKSLSRSCTGTVPIHSLGSLQVDSVGLEQQLGLRMWNCIRAQRQEWNMWAPLQRCG